MTQSSFVKQTTADLMGGDCPGVSTEDCDRTSRLRLVDDKTPGNDIMESLLFLREGGHKEANVEYET